MSQFCNTWGAFRYLFFYFSVKRGKENILMIGAIQYLAFKQVLQTRQHYLQHCIVPCGEGRTKEGATNCCVNPSGGSRSYVPESQKA